MHELALMEDLVTAVAEKIRDAGVSRVVSLTLEVGKLSGAAPEALSFCFDVCANGTPVEGAVLRIERRDGTELRLIELEVS